MFYFFDDNYLLLPTFLFGSYNLHQGGQPFWQAGKKMDEDNLVGKYLLFNLGQKWDFIYNKHYKMSWRAFQKGLAGKKCPRAMGWPPLIYTVSMRNDLENIKCLY